MKYLNSTEALAHKQQHPVKKPVYWQVIHCGKPVFNHDLVSACNKHITDNNLKNAKIRGKYN